MFARMTSWKSNDASIVQSSVESKREEILAVPGMLACYVVYNEDGTGVTFAVYESEAAAQASAAQIQAIYAELASIFTAPPETVTYSGTIHLK
ncbi:MAG: hypothetical protein AAGB07_03520 [Pseudomonadota bacterium]